MAISFIIFAFSSISVLSSAAAESVERRTEQPSSVKDSLERDSQKWSVKRLSHQSMIGELRRSFEIGQLKTETELIKSKTALAKAKSELKSAEAEAGKTPGLNNRKLPTAKVRQGEGNRPVGKRPIAKKKPRHFSLLEVYGTRQSTGYKQGLVAVIQSGAVVVTGTLGSGVTDGWVIHSISPTAVTLKKGEITRLVDLAAGRVAVGVQK